LVPAAFAVVSTHSSFKVMSGRRPVVKIIVESLSYDEKHVIPIPLSGIRVGRRRILIISMCERVSVNVV
jgi:hypothetical protein